MEQTLLVGVFGEVVVEGRELRRAAQRVCVERRLHEQDGHDGVLRAHGVARHQPRVRLGDADEAFQQPHRGPRRLGVVRLALPLEVLAQNQLRVRVQLRPHSRLHVCCLLVCWCCFQLMFVLVLLVVCDKQR